MKEYKYINSRDDAALFLQKTNGLHDGYIVGFEYSNDGIEAGDGWTSVNLEKSELRIRVLITSLEEKPTVELIFSGILDWKIKSGVSVVFGSTIGFDEGAVIWADAHSLEREVLRESSFVKAADMRWRFL